MTKRRIMMMTSRPEKTDAGEHARTALLERDVELAVNALKKGAQLLKYGRRGKPKFCSFRLANDESALIWLSGKEEKHIKLGHVSRIVPGQCTPVFQRYPQPEKECQSFSLLCNGRSLDLICKDKDETEVWFTGLKTLISRHHLHKGREAARSKVSSEANSSRARMQSYSLGSALGSGKNLQEDGMDWHRLHTPYDSTSKVRLERALSDIVLYALPPKVLLTSGAIPSFASEGTNRISTCVKGLNVDASRVSISSALSSSSQGSGLDDGDALGDVYIWGEGTGNGLLGGGTHRVEGSGMSMDSFVPKALESAVLLDVQGIACGRQHAALVTKQGEVFSWGKEHSGRLGHGIDSDVLHPELVGGLKNINVESVACGEYHSCAVTLSGELYMWGGHTHGFGLLGCTQEAVNWIPKKLCGPLEGVHVSSVSCGPWHTAVVTSAGQLFTFGDGTFGVLGHGDSKSVSKPREVKSLKGLRTVTAACGVWHTAAIVEVIGSSTSSSCSSGKLFTWGDGDKGRLGHGDKESKLVPTCVAALVEPNFRLVACGHSLTAAVTSTGHVYTTGSPVYGQLGNPHTDGKVPSRVEGKLLNSFVEEIACGAYHVAVLTSKTEVFTWGKGANGRLGHGDSDNRNSPSIVEALKDKEVKSIVCGTSFTAAICHHKWVSGTDQSMCSGCQLTFNFKRKRRNCYNCGLVFCHSCSSRKSLKASMAPNPDKAYRVCNNCLSKLSKGKIADSSLHSTLSRRGSVNQGASEINANAENMNTRSHVELGRNSSIELSKNMQNGSFGRNNKLNSSITQVSASANDPSQRDTSISSKSFGSSKKFFPSSLFGSRIVSQASSPPSKGSGLSCAMAQIPTLSAFSFPKAIIDDDRRSDASLTEEAVNLRAQVDELMLKVRLKEVELEKTTKQLKNALATAGDENAKRIAAKEVIKSLTAQLKDLAEKLPVGAVTNSKSHSAYSGATLPRDVSSAVVEQLSRPTTCQKPDSNGSKTRLIYVPGTTTNATSDHSEVARSVSTVRSKSRTAKVEPTHADEWIEQDEPGVYVTLVSFPGGAKDLKRVHFSRKRFNEKQAEQWWAGNKDRLYEQYNISMVDTSIVSTGRKD